MQTVGLPAMILVFAFDRCTYPRVHSVCAARRGTGCCATGRLIALVPGTQLAESQASSCLRSTAVQQRRAALGAWVYGNGSRRGYFRTKITTRTALPLSLQSRKMQARKALSSKWAILGAGSSGPG